MEPLVFEPYLRPLVWGGRKLGEQFGKQLPPDGTFGESWELSVHPHHVSLVAEGPLQGKSLAELCAERPRELFGAPTNAARPFPLLVKLLDARELLSVQVHPSDALAPRLAGEPLGKTEAWVILDVSPGGRVYAGLRPGVTRQDLERHLEAGTVDQCLHELLPRPGDCLFYPAGTVHAVGGGVMIAEVQQSSDATLRLFDWNRLGADGKPRPLHVRQALEAIDWSIGPVRPVEGTPLPGLPDGVKGERLVRCPYFHLDRFSLQGSLASPHGGRLSIWMVLDGRAELGTEAGYQRMFQRGETVLVPAACQGANWNSTAKATLLTACLP
jgi:mannose-6-phosphate isomerase